MKKKFFIVLILTLLPCCVFAAEKPMPRVLVALYDSRWESSQRTTFVHRFLEMPANHLGYDIQYYDIMSPLPKLGNNVAGIILWFNSGTQVPNTANYLAWLTKAETEGKKLLVIENGGLGQGHQISSDVLWKWNNILSYIGIYDDESWNEITYHADISYMDKSMMDFERKIVPPYPPLSRFHLLPGSKAKSHLQMHLLDSSQDNSFDMVVTGPHGGFVAPGYAVYTEDDKNEQEIHFWYINPFLFLKQALGSELSPVPDVTTLDGKRIFYSHIDGDGWNNITEIERYNPVNMLSSEVIYKEILKPYSDFAFDVAVIAGDVDPACFAVPDSARVAREIFALPNVEPSSHTYSHPLYWDFFKNYTPEKEKPLLKYYPPKPSQAFSAVQMMKRNLLESNWLQKPDKDSELPQKHNVDTDTQPKSAKLGRNDKTEEEILKDYNYTPRSYACSPFDLDQEITGAVKIINSLAPAGKTVRLLQWPGDTEPYERVMETVQKAGLLNLNGGDSRFDNENPSYSFVAPIGIKIGNYRQIYSSNSNEETYTNDWHDRYFGFRYLQVTVKNTESPIRVSPFNIYFHMFSGQKEASLNAIKENLNFARTQNIIPITASDYSAIAEGFYSTAITQDGDLLWNITNRGDMETVRFDNADRYSVDFVRSQGVIGQNRFQGSLYIALDPAASNASVQLKSITDAREPVHELYLLESSWRIKSLQRAKNAVTFEANGYGTGKMTWNAEAGTAYLVDIKTGGKSSKVSVTSSNTGILTLFIPDISTNQPVIVAIQKKQGA